MERQNILQLLPLPREMIHLVKEYAFYTKDHVIAKQRHHQIMNDIQCAICKGDDGHNTYFPLNSLFLFWSGKRKDPQYQIEFCTTCGGYVQVSNMYAIIQPSLWCTC
jgi:hypothetical protein